VAQVKRLKRELKELQEAQVKRLDRVLKDLREQLARSVGILAGGTLNPDGSVAQSYGRKFTVSVIYREKPSP
jgi:hypothetical protein